MNTEYEKRTEESNNSRLLYTLNCIQQIVKLTLIYNDHMTDKADVTRLKARTYRRLFEVYMIDVMEDDNYGNNSRLNIFPRIEQLLEYWTKDIEKRDNNRKRLHEQI